MKGTNFICPEIGILPYLVRMPKSGMVYAEPGEFIPEHKHQLIEIHYLIKGTATFKTRQGDFNLKQNDLVISECGDTHSVYFITRAVLFYIQLAIDEWGPRYAMVYMKSVIRPPDGSTANNPVRAILRSPSRVLAADPPVRESIVRGWPVLISKRLSRQDVVAGKVRCFCTALGRLLAKSKKTTEKHQPPDWTLLPERVRRKIRQAKRYLDQHFGAPGSLDQLARNACLSQKHFERLFKTATGYSPRRYMMEKRMQKALQLLRQRDLKIETIITESGFRNRSHFFRTFTKRTGLSPDRFRRNIRLNRYDPFRDQPV